MSTMKTMTVTLARGALERSVTPDELARELGLETVLPALVALLLRPPDRGLLPPGIGPTDPGGKGGPIDRSIPSDRSIASPEYLLAQGDRSMQPGPGIDVGALARKLAQDLDDPGGLAWYGQVAATLQEATVLAALTRTLRVPAAKIRASRAAYFTAIIAPLVRTARTLAARDSV